VRILNQNRKIKWLLSIFILVGCLGILLFAFLFNREEEGLETALKTGLETELLAEKNQILLTESEDKRIVIWGAPKAESGMIEQITVSIDKKEKTFAWRNSTNPSFYPEIWLANLAGDDNLEVIIALTLGTGTGIHESEVHVLNSDFSEIKVNDPIKELKPLIQTSKSEKAGKQQYSIKVAGREHLFEYKESDAGFWFDDVAFGSVINYRVEDQALISEVSAQVSPGTFPGGIKLTYALKAGILEAYRVEWINGEAEAAGKVRAMGETAFGEIVVISENQETSEVLGAPSCLGLAEDYRYKSSYQVIFKNKADKEQIISENEIKEIIAPNAEIIPLNKLSFKIIESLGFIPQYTDCHGVPFYLYGVTEQGAFPFEFQTEQGTTAAFSIAPNSKPEVIDDLLVLDGGRAAADVGYATRYFFKPDVIKKTMVLQKTEKINEALLDYIQEATNVAGVHPLAEANTLTELYDYYSAYFTKNYVDKIILQNLKQKGNKWVIAHPESEKAEASYYETSFDARTIVDEMSSKATVTSEIGDGLYAAHKEIISLIFTKGGWRIDNLRWE